jgi:hypothetical protein
MLLWLTLALADPVPAQRGERLVVPETFPPCHTTHAVARRPFPAARASSALAEGSLTHGAERAIDGDLATAWVEGVDGPGHGQTLRVKLDEEGALPTGLWVVPGYAKDAARWGKNRRVQVLEVRFLKAKEGIDPAKAWSEDALVPTDTGPLRTELQTEGGNVPMEGQSIPLTGHFHQNMEVTEVVALELAILATDGAGAAYDDTCISEVAQLEAGDVQSRTCAKGWCEGPGAGSDGCR